MESDYDPLDGEEDVYLSQNGGAPAITRRHVLKLAAGTVAATAISPLLSLPSMASDAPRVALDGGLSAVPRAQLVTLAMHVHSSFSELQASMECQLSEAAANGIDYLWWTEHDWRMSSTCYRTQVSFDSLTSEFQFGNAWLWQPTTSGQPTSVTGGIVHSPISAKEPSPNGALGVSLSQTKAGNSAFGYLANTTGSHYNHRSNFTGLTIRIRA